MARGLTRAKISNQTVISLAKAPTGGPQTIDPYFTGGNILTDPGFENFVDNSGGWYYWDRPGGATSYTIPKLTIHCPRYLYYPDLTCITQPSFVAWAQSSGTYQTSDLREDHSWKVSTHDPHSGDYHAMWVRWLDDSGFPPGNIMPFSPFISAPHSARVEPGDTVTWSAYLYYAGDGWQGSTVPILQFYNSGGSIVHQAQGATSSLTTTYTQYSVSTTAPAGSYYLRAIFSFSGTLRPGDDHYSVFFDTASLGIEP